MVVIGRFDDDIEDTIDLKAHLLVVVVAVVVAGAGAGVGGGCGGGTCWMYARATRTSADQLNRRTRTMNPMTEGRQWSRSSKRTSTSGNGFVCQDGTCFIVIRWSYG